MQSVKKIVDFVIPGTGKKAVKRADIARQYQQNPSFSDLLPWVEWSDEHNAMLLEDGCSVGAGLEWRDIATEAATDNFIKKLHKNLAKMLSSVVPLEDKDPWVLQIFIQDELSLNPLYKRFVEYAAEKGNINDELTQHYLTMMKAHFDNLTKEEGVFQDPMSGLKFRGKMRRIRALLYRRYSTTRPDQDTEVLEELDFAVQRLMSQLKQMGIKVRRLQGRHFYDWLVRWFNPRPKKTDGNTDTLLKRFPYPEKKKPFGWSFSQNVFFGEVSSYDEGWIIDGLKHKVLVFNDLQEEVDIGVISRERNLGDNSKYALMDKFPPGTIYTIQIAFESKLAVKNHLEKIEKAAVGKAKVVEQIIENRNRADLEMENGNMLFRTVEAIYFRGENDAKLRKNENSIIALLNQNGLDVMPTKNEIFPKDIYLRFLPFNYSYSFDEKNTYRSTYKYADDVARLLPVYGRAKGDVMNPLFIHFNRGGEAFAYDFLSRNFKMSNSHMAILGTTGSGKSVLMNSIILPLSAIYNPRIVVLETGGSFDIMANYLKKHGRNVRRMKFEMNNPIPVNPYAEAYKALAQIEAEEFSIKGKAKKDINPEEEVIVTHSAKLNEEVATNKKEASNADQEENQERDIFNEIVLSTRLMITRGDAKEEEKIDLTDMTLITRGLLYAMKTCRDNKVPQVLVMHVAKSFAELAEKEENLKLKGRYEEFALRLEYYITDPTRARFVNHESEPLEDCDFLQVDFGFLKSATYKDLMSVACISLLSKILALAEAAKDSGRPMILLIDEAHVQLKVETIAVFVTLMLKVARKVGLSLIPCTQNVTDFTGVEAKKILTLIETWLLLSLDATEIEHVEKSKPLGEEKRALALDVRKYPGIYSEGLLLGKRYFGLFRNIPPKIVLSLALTDPDERTQRKRVEEEHGLSELEAVEYIAKQMENTVHEINEDTEFYD